MAAKKACNMNLFLKKILTECFAIELSDMSKTYSYRRVYNCMVHDLNHRRFQQPLEHLNISQHTSEETDFLISFFHWGTSKFPILYFNYFFLLRIQIISQHVSTELHRIDLSKYHIAVYTSICNNQIFLIKL